LDFEYEGWGGRPKKTLFSKQMGNGKGGHCRLANCRPTRKKTHPSRRVFKPLAPKPCRRVKRKENRKPEKAKTYIKSGRREEFKIE